MPAVPAVALAAGDLGGPWLRHGHVDDLAWSQHWGRGFGARLYRRTSENEYLDGFAMNAMARPWVTAQRGRRFFLLSCDTATRTPPTRPPARYRTLFYDGDPTTTNRGSLDSFYARPLKPYLVGAWLGSAARAWPGAAGERIEDLEWCRAQYDAEVRALDDAVAELLDHLDGLGVLERTLVVVLGDHGESSGRAWRLLRAPWALRRDHAAAPDPPRAGSDRGRAAGRLGRDDTRSRADDPRAARPPGPRRQWRGAPWWGPSPAQPPSTARRRVVASEATWMCKWAYRTDEYKLIVAREADLYGGPPVELYDLAADPEETVNLADTWPDLRDALRAEFEGWLGRRLAARGRRRDPVAAHGSCTRSSSGRCRSASGSSARSAPGGAAPARPRPPPKRPRGPGVMITLVMAVRDALPWTRRAIDSIARHTGDPFELIVVDNGSGAETGDYLRGTAARVIRNEENRGCAAAWNQGIAAARGEQVCLVNSDVEVPAGWLARLAAFHETHPFVWVSPAIREGPLDYDLEALNRRSGPGTATGTSPTNSGAWSCSRGATSTTAWEGSTRPSPTPSTRTRTCSGGSGEPASARR